MPANFEVDSISVPVDSNYARNGPFAVALWKKASLMIAYASASVPPSYRRLPGAE